MSDLVAELGIASARIYKAFGSKEQLFRQAIAHYESQEGGFCNRAFAENNAEAIKKMLVDAVRLYSQTELPRGCMVVASAARLSARKMMRSKLLAEHRLQRTQQIIDRLRDRRRITASYRIQPMPTVWETIFSPSFAWSFRSGARRCLRSAIVGGS